MKRVKISIVIPVYNGGTFLQKLLEAIFRQELSDEIEVIVIDSGSTDESLSIVQQFPIRLYQISKNEFNHGSTRNLGVQLAKGEYVVMTVQDALPSNTFWLNELVSGFVNQDVAGVCGQQIVPQTRDHNPFEWFRPISKPALTQYQYKNTSEFDDLSAQEKKKVCRWDNVNAIYRKSVLLEHPFQIMDFAEDAAWAKDILQAGYSIVYNPLAQVKHYHSHKPDFTYRRTFFIHYYRYRLFKYLPNQGGTSILKTLRKIKTLIFRSPKIPIHKKTFWWNYQFQKEKCINKATKDFLKLLEQGDQVLEKEFSKFKENVPVASETSQQNQIDTKPQI